MTLVPGLLWRCGPVNRALGAGLAAGVFSGALVLLESGSWAAATVVLVVLGLLFGARVPRRMGRLWPAGLRLAPDDRATVVRATRRGEAPEEPRLAPAVAEYAAALRRGAEEDRSHRWIIPLVTVAAVALAVYDTLAGSFGEMLVSWLVVALFLGELLWWPRARARLLARTDRAEASTRRTDPGRAPDSTP
ncbi:hypothetical protein [Streptomyces sp. NPDC051452]|uniref:hypothetical protein n=1 Tax=Streptomyces sp. NPDC051452 TaxID=3365654 RepID=UPI0037BA315E